MSESLTEIKDTLVRRLRHNNGCTGRLGLVPSHCLSCSHVSLITPFNCGYLKNVQVATMISHSRRNRCLPLPPCLTTSCKSSQPFTWAQSLKLTKATSDTNMKLNKNIKSFFFFSKFITMIYSLYRRR